MATPQLYYKNGNSWQSAMLNSYPVGAIYSSTSSTNPGSIFGGGWVEITGAVLRGNKQAGVYSDSDECKLTVNQIPSHNHGAPTGYFVCITNDASMRNITPRIQSGSRGDNSWGGHLAETSSQMNLPTANTGGEQAHTNKQRAFNVYMWRRTS